MTTSLDILFFWMAFYLYLGGFLLFVLYLGVRNPKVSFAASGLMGLGFAAVRVALPLAYLGHQSELSQIRRDLADRRAAGQPIAYPVALPKANHFIVLYYFSDDFDVTMERKPGASPLDVTYLLHPKR